MAKTPNTKRRVVELLKLLFDKTDETHGLTLAEIATHLEGLGITSERKALYDDVATLRSCGIDVVVERHGGRTVYRLARRPVPLAELSLLVDCVQSSPFLTDELAAKACADLERLASSHERGRLVGQIEVPGRTHLANGGVFENLAAIRDALSRRQKVTFRYFTYDGAKGRRYHEYEGGPRALTPVRLVFAGEVYYLVVWEPWYEELRYYRVDRMEDVRVTGEPANRNERIATYSVAGDESVAFGLFVAERETVSLLLEPYFVNALVDRFGLGVATYPQPDGRVKANVRVTLSPAFFGWVFSLHGGCQIEGPRDAIDKYREYVGRALEWLG